MKLVTGIVTSLVIGSLSFGAFAAQELEKDKVAGMNLTKVGEISTSDTTAPMDAKESCLRKRMSWVGSTTSSPVPKNRPKTCAQRRTSISNTLMPGSDARLYARSAHHSLRQAFPSGQLLQLPDRQPSASS